MCKLTVGFSIKEYDNDGDVMRGTIIISSTAWRIAFPFESIYFFKRDDPETKIYAPSGKLFCCITQDAPIIEDDYQGTIKTTVREHISLEDKRRLPEKSVKLFHLIAWDIMALVFSIIHTLNEEESPKKGFQSTWEFSNDNFSEEDLNIILQVE